MLQNRVFLSILLLVRELLYTTNIINTITFVYGLVTIKRAGRIMPFKKK